MPTPLPDRTARGSSPTRTPARIASPGRAATVVATALSGCRSALVAIGLGIAGTGALAQAPCGAAGGPPGGAGVCDYLAEATGLPPSGPATAAGNPIDLVTGNKYRRDVDLRVRLPVPLVFARHYNSRNRHAGPLGAGWSHTFETRLGVVRAGARETVQVVQGDGRRLVFERDAVRSDRWRTRDPAQGHLGAGGPRPQDRWTWHWGGGRTLHFDANGALSRVEQAGVALHVLERDAAGRLLAVSTDGGWRLDFAYAPHPLGERLVRITAGDLVVAHFAYDEAGQLASVTWPDGRIRRHAYEDPLDPLRLTGVFEVDVSTGVAERRVATYAHDSQGRAVATDEGDGRLSVAYRPPRRAGDVGETTVTDRDGRVARYRWTYDAHRHVGRLLGSSGEACASCPAAPRSYRWDAAGRLVGIDAPGQSLDLERDASGRPVGALGRAADGRRERLWRAGYGAAGSAVAWIEQPSVAPGRTHRIELERDRHGRVVAVAERGFAPDVDEAGRSTWTPLSRRFELGFRDAEARAAVTGPELAWIDGPEPGPVDRIALSARHDGLALDLVDGGRETLRWAGGLPLEHRGPDGTSWRFRAALPSEHWLGGPTVVAAYSGARSLELDHAPFGGLRGVVLTDPARGVEQATSTPPAAGPPRYRVLAHWRALPTAIALPDGSLYRRGFDDFGRVAWIEPPGLPREWARYDRSDRLVAHRHGDGTWMRYRRAPSGRLVETLRESPGGVEVIGRYRWDGSRLVEAGNDTVTVRYEWGEDGRPVAAEHVFADADHPVLRWGWQRDLAGRLVVETMPRGVRVRYAYDGPAVSRLTVEVPGHAPLELDPRSLRVPSRLSRSVPYGGMPRSDLLYAGGRLIGSPNHRYLSDPHGLRAAKDYLRSNLKVPTRTFVHHDWRLRAQRRFDGQFDLWIWADDQPVAMVADDLLLRVYTDERLAPVRAVQASDGVEFWSANYTRNGLAHVRPASGVQVHLRLPGQYADPETGYHYNHWRTYDPVRGRYLEPDPLGLQPGFSDRDSLTRYADGDPVTGFDPWGLATLSFYAITTGANGRPIGRTQGFDRARWSFMIESIEPTPLAGNGRSPPAPSGIGSLIFDPWGDYIGGRDDPGVGLGNDLDTITWTGSRAPGTTGAAIFDGYVAHYASALLEVRPLNRAFLLDDRRAGALALILAAEPADRAACIGAALAALPGFGTQADGGFLRPARADPAGPPRLLSCRDPATLPLEYADDLERSRVERYQAAAEVQESPSASFGEDCRPNVGCRSRGRIVVNGRAYHASYGRTQFTVTTFLAELMRLTANRGSKEASALRDAIGLDRRLPNAGWTVADRLALARQRVDATYRAFAALRNEFGRGLSVDRAGAIWDSLPAARRERFEHDTGLDWKVFVDILGYLPGQSGWQTEEEGRHAIAAAAAATVTWSKVGEDGSHSIESWMIELFSSKAPYDHVSRAFLRDNLRSILASKLLTGRFDNTAKPGTDAWRIRQREIELDLARRVAVLHNSGRLDLATQPDLDRWLGANGGSWIAQYARQFTEDNARGNWDALHCAPSLPTGAALQMTVLAAQQPLPRAGPARRLLAR